MPTLRLPKWVGLVVRYRQLLCQQSTDPHQIMAMLQLSAQAMMGAQLLILRDDPKLWKSRNTGDRTLLIGRWAKPCRV